MGEKSGEQDVYVTELIDIITPAEREAAGSSGQLPLEAFSCFSCQKS